jgi:hypothetical protein
MASKTARKPEQTIAEETAETLDRPAPGRPRGAASSHAPGTHAVKPMCCKCQSSALKRFHVLSDVRLPTPHTDPTGHVATHRRITRARCTKCATWQPLVEFYNP